MISLSSLRRMLATSALALSATAGAQSSNLQSVAHNLVRAGLVKAGDKVLISGSVRDAALLEAIAVETMKVGADPLISIWSDRLTRRSYDEVPASFDNVTSEVGKLIVENFDVQIALDIAEGEGVLAGVPVARIAARNKAAQPINDAYFKRNLRTVNLGNGLYPTTSTSRRLGVNQSALASLFWRAASVNPASLRTRGEALRQKFAQGKVVTLTTPNGTNITFAVDVNRALISDGALTADRVKQGSAAATTWLPAGELIVPAANGSANGKIVVDRLLWDGRIIRGLTLDFKDGVLESMTAANDMSRLKAAYDAATGSKDRFGFVDIGLNPETRLPLGSGRIVWTAPGSVTIGVGDNRAFGGTNSSDFGFPAQLGDATLKVDGTSVVANGRLR